MKDIYKAQVKNLVKQHFLFKKWSNDAIEISDKLDEEIESLLTELEEINSFQGLQPNEKYILIIDRTDKIQELVKRKAALLEEVKNKHDLLTKERNVLVTTYLEEYPHLNEKHIQTIIDNEILKNS